jgi:hypothetical protein
VLGQSSLSVSPVLAEVKVFFFDFFFYFANICIGDVKKQKKYGANDVFLGVNATFLVFFSLKACLCLAKRLCKQSFYKQVYPTLCLLRR